MMADVEQDPRLQDTPYDIYSLAKRLAIGKEVFGLHRIYLDEKYWIFCREAFLGKPRRDIHVDIWRGLCDLVTKNVAICPVCEPVVSEMMKMPFQRRRATAHVIDRLSRGVAIQLTFRRFAIELSHFVWTKLFGVTTLSPLLTQVWIPVAYFLGEEILTVPGLSPTRQGVLQKAMFDHLERTSLREIVDVLGPGPSHIGEDDSAMEAALSLGAASSRHTFKTFRQAFGIEVDGGLDGLSDHIREFAEHLFEQERAINLDDQPVASASQSAENLMAILRSGLKSGRITTTLPICHINANIHAAVRHKRQKYRRGDSFDRRHAEAALPYCDAFLTERTLSSLLSTKPLELDRQYDCRVFWREKDVVRYLGQLARP